MKNSVKGMYFLLLILISVVFIISCEPEIEDPKLYTISYDANDADGGTVPENQTKIQGENVILANNEGNLARIGYTHAGWNSQADGSGTDYAPEASFSINADIALYAKWDANEYNIIYELTSGINDESNPATYTIETPTITLQNATRDGYTFSGWYDAETGGAKVTEIVKGSTDNKSLYARWTVNQYIVTFKDYEGTTLKEETVAHGSAATAPANPSRTGYAFTGWDVEFTNLTSALTVTAEYKINQYTITFDSAGGSEVDPITQNYGTSITAPANPTKEGYTFDDWDPVVPKTMPAENIMITAQWIANRYTVFFKTNNVGNMDQSSIEVTYDSTYGELPSPSSKIVNYDTFKGWYSDQATSEGNEVNKDNTVIIAGNHKLYAKWEELTVGDLGPGGGYIFYENSNYETDDWRYLEAAPKGWSGIEDPSFKYGKLENAKIGGTRQDVGSGKENTQQIIEKLGDGDYAAKIADDYELTVDGVKYTDWFLPSKDELYEMYLNLKKQGLGGFANAIYWSSSEWDHNNAHIQNFSGGSGGIHDRNDPRRVRPVRSF